jgi:hypothetical protein
MKICTLAIPTTNLGYVSLQKSAKYAAVQVTEISNGASWEGFVTKMKLYKAAAQQAIQEGERLLIFIDAFDVLIHPDAMSRLKRLEQWFDDHPNTKMIVSRETSCLSHHNCLPLRPYTDTIDVSRQNLKKIYANSGIISGRPEALLAWATFMESYKFLDDQIALSSFMNLHKYPYVDIDTEDTLLATTVTTWKHLFPMTTEQIRSPFVHFPGFAHSGASFAYRSLSYNWTGDVGFPLKPAILRDLGIVIAVIVALLYVALIKYQLGKYFVGAGVVGLAWILWIDKVFF